MSREGSVIIKIKVAYFCSKCGQESPRWSGKCSGCNSWNTLEEVVAKPKKNSPFLRKNAAAKRLSEIESCNSDRIVTALSEFNRVLGGGIVKDSTVILSARPGAGKSTLLLQAAADVASQGYKVLYASAEESESQIKSRADRILGPIDGSIWIIADTSMDNVLRAIAEIDPEMIIIDSIQTFSLEAYNSRPGSPLQTMECANELVKIAKNSDKPRAVIMVGQMTKDDEIAGLRALEHLVDTVLIIDGESGEELRGLLCTKNRFGGTGEMGFFAMTEAGMTSIENPSEFFMTKREEGESVSGSALTVIREGSRPIIVEIESLVSKSFTPYPSRIAECLRRDQFNTLISILEQRGGIDLYSKDVVLKTTGGLQLKEQSVNLAVMMAIVSSIRNMPIPADIAFIADVGLTGELKKVPLLENRVRELARMGFRTVYVAGNALQDLLKFKNIEIIELRTLSAVISHLDARIAAVARTASVKKQKGL